MSRSAGKRIVHCCHSGNQQQGRAFTPASRFARVVLVPGKVPFSVETCFGGFMKRNAPILLLVATVLVVAIVALSGCGVVAQQSGSPIMVTMTTPPPSSIPAGGTASVAATVSNDTAGAGVSWSCTPSSACGSFNPVSTMTGASTIYTAPSAAPAGGQVAIMATSMTDSTKKANTSVMITGSSSNASLKGKYALLLTAATGNQGTSVIAASVTADGNGLITGGVVELTAPGFYDLVDVISDGTYSIDACGHGTMHVNAGRSFVYYIISPKVLRVLEGDNISFVGGSAYAQGSAGSTIAALSGKFVYQHHGWSSPGRTVAAGQFSADGTGRITAGVSDSNFGGSPTIVNMGKSVTGMYLISGSPSGTLTLSDAAGTSTFNLYLVDPALNTLDPSNSTGGGGALLLHTDASIIGTGILIPQIVSGSPSFSQNHVLNLVNSVDTANAATVNEVHLVGKFARDGAANFTGTADYGQNSSNTQIVVKGNTLSGTFAADSVNAGHFTGSFTLGTDPAIALFPFISPAVSTLQVSYYQDSSSPALVIPPAPPADAWGYLLKQLP